MYYETFLRIVDSINTLIWVPVTLIEAPVAYRSIKAKLKRINRKKGNPSAMRTKPPKSFEEY